MISSDEEMVDVVMEKNDAMQVEFQKQITGLTLYVHINGVTILRVGQINPSILEIDIPEGITVYEV